MFGIVFFIYCRKLLLLRSFRLRFRADLLISHSKTAVSSGQEARFVPGQLGDKTSSENTGFWQHADAEACVFTVALASMFPELCVFKVRMGLRVCL